MLIKDLVLDSNVALKYPLEVPSIGHRKEVGRSDSAVRQTGRDGSNPYSHPAHDDDLV